MTVHNHGIDPTCPESIVNGRLLGACISSSGNCPECGWPTDNPACAAGTCPGGPVSDHETIRDQAAIRASWDGDCPDVTRIVRRVGAALNSGRDRAVVDVVLDETQAARDEADTLRTQLAAVRALVDAAGPGFMTFGGGYSGGIVDAQSLLDILGES